MSVKGSIDMDQHALNFPDHVQIHRAFLRGFQQLPDHSQQAVRATIVRLRENPAHPALHAHALHRLPGAQECYVSKSLRLIYCAEPPVLHLLNVGPHRCIEQAHFLHLP
jgi:mRNA-degrading endonuclease YafQ of YafQ-DinJ toxin-antitoxin module